MKGLFLNHIKLNGIKQMQLDRFLLEKSITNPAITLIARFYSWEGNWISFGKNQLSIPPKWEEISRRENVKFVRRPSGGDAVIHKGGITYSIIWSNPPIKKKEAYFQASKWIINGFKEIGISLNFGSELQKKQQNCFSTSTSADLVDNKGNKRVGSAQYWKNKHLLQHGEILFEPSEKLWELFFDESAPKLERISLTTSQVEKILTKSIKSYWKDLEWEHININFEEIFNKNKSNLNCYLI